MTRDTDASPPTRTSIVPNARALILCVERDPHVRELEAFFLDQAGFVVHFADNGAEALEQARSLRPAMDVVMPGLSARAMADAIHQTRPGLPILFMSGYPGQDVVRRGLLGPGDPFIQKPFAVEDLAGVVRAQLDQAPRTS